METIQGKGGGSMRKTKLLDNLFSEWEKAHQDESEESCKKTINGDRIKKHFFERDGIISENDFEKEKTKILFVMAEANIDKYTKEGWNGKMDYREIYKNYYNDQTGKDEWKGKMKERLSALYGYMTSQTHVAPHLLANKYAVMDLNKRGGKAKIGRGAHIVEYVRVYRSFLRKELEIINPDIVVWVGTNIYRLGIPKLLGAKEDRGNLCFEIEGRSVPIISIWQTSYYQARIEPLPPEECGTENRIIRKLCAKAKIEMGKLIRNS